MVIVAGVFGLVINKVLDNSNDALGSALTNSSARGSMELRTQLSDIIKDLTGATYSAAYDPSSFSSSTMASTTITVNGAAVGDYAVVNFATTTSGNQWQAIAKVDAANSVIVNLVAIPGTTAWNSALDLGSATLRVQVSSSTPNSTTSF